MCRKTCEVLRYQRGVHLIWYDIYLLQLGFHPVAVVGTKLYKIGKRQLYTRGETMHKTKQKHRTHKIENKNTKQDKRHEKNINKISRVIVNNK